MPIFGFGGRKEKYELPIDEAEILDPVEYPPSERIDPAKCESEGVIRREVGIASKVEQFGDVSLMDHTFKCDVTFCLDWVPTVRELQAFVETENSSLPDDIAFNPNLYCKNATKQEECEAFKQTALRYSETYDKYLFQKQFHWRLTCRQRFRLRHFPLDCQDLGICIHVGNEGRSKADTILVPSRAKPWCLQVVTKYNALDDFYVDRTFLTFKTEDDHKVAKRDGRPSSEAHIVIKVIRRWERYFWQHFSLISFVSVSSLACYWMKPVFEKRVERIAWVGTMLLTMIAFQFVTLNKLPELPYVTYMDHYVNIQFFFLAVNLFTVCITPEFFDEVECQWFTESEYIDGHTCDWWMGGACGALWGILHFSMLVTAYCRRKQERKKLEVPLYERSEEKAPTLKVTPVNTKLCNFIGRTPDLLNKLLVTQATLQRADCEQRRYDRCHNRCLRFLCPCCAKPPPEGLKEIALRERQSRQNIVNLDASSPSVDPPEVPAINPELVGRESLGFNTDFTCRDAVKSMLPDVHRSSWVQDQDERETEKNGGSFETGAARKNSGSFEIGAARKNSGSFVPRGSLSDDSHTVRVSSDFGTSTSPPPSQEKAKPDGTSCTRSRSAPALGHPFKKGNRPSRPSLKSLLCVTGKSNSRLRSVSIGGVRGTPSRRSDEHFV